MGLGYLTVSARMADGALPIADALVIVKDKQGNVLFEVHTDANGNTGTFSLPCPDKYLSLDSAYSQPAYAVYDVEISKPGYQSVYVHDVQIVDTVEAIQPCDMHPVPEDEAPHTEHIYIPTLSVLTDEQSSQVGYMGVTRNSRFTLQPDVVIPDFINVKLGRPTSTARVVRVSFPDYIKNVTSSEIYPTWPLSSLIANIHAIVTFTLNRVYSEWYPSRGFNFNITNTTQYDQAFVYGRTIFRNISDLVDQYFNVFARRFGFRNPYFTSYCNGTTARCGGLSQWGTVTLANRGFSPLQILHYYYPRDIELVTSHNIGPITDSFPGVSLREGSTGDDVRRIQFMLNRIRQNFPLIPLIPNVNGVYGPETTAAVRAFQRSFNLTQDGVVGRQTWNNITRIYTAVIRLSELEGEGERISIGQNPPNVVLRNGSSGNHVRELQFILNVISTYYASVPSVTMDGRFGPMTESAVREFQRTFGLTADGVVGPATWNKLYSVYRSLASAGGGGGGGTTPPPPPPPPPPPGPVPTHPPYPGVLTRQGDRNDNVRVIQTLINRVADRVQGIPRLNVDGVFGPLTDNAVRTFQTRFGLNPDGIVGPLTWAALVREANAGGGGGGTTPPPPPPPPVTPGPVPTHPPYPGVLTRQGDRNDNVRVIQTLINRVADRVQGIPRLNVDGVFGPLTDNAVRTFQTRFGLNPDGIVGPLTWAALVREANAGGGGTVTLPPPVTPPSPPPPPTGDMRAVCRPYPGTPLRVGSTGDDVRFFQQFYNDWVARVNPSATRLSVDGNFGPMTQNAVMAFQRHFGLSADGVVGPITWERMLRECLRMRG